MKNEYGYLNRNIGMRKEEKDHPVLDKISLVFRYMFVLFLIAFIILTIRGKNQFSEYVAKAIPGNNVYVISISDGDELVQKYTPNIDNIGQLDFRIVQNNGDNRQGSLDISIEDSKGKSIYQKTLTMAEVDGRAITRATMSKKKIKYRRWLHLMVNQSVNKGETYTVRLKGTGISKITPLYIFHPVEKGSTFGKLTKNEKVYPGCIAMRPWTTQLDIWALVLTIAIAVFLIALIFIPIHLPERINRWVSWIYFALVPFLTLYMVEKTFYYSVLSMLRKRPLAYIINILLYATVFLILLLITNRIRAAIISGTVLLYGCAVANYFVLLFRGTPITPSDIFAAGTAMDVAENYTLTFNKAAIVATIVMLAICVTARKLDSFPCFKIRNRLIVAALVVVMAVGEFNLCGQTDFLGNYYVRVQLWKQKTGYRRQGYVLSFMMNLHYLFGVKPDGYNAEEVEKIAKNYKVTTGENKALKKKPNIIVIMNESLSDLNVVNKIETNKEVFPFLNGLKENTIKGELLMSIFGGGTSNSEYEFLTGNSLLALPAGCNAYTQYIKDQVPNLTNQLKEQGYDTVAFHPYFGNGWNRDKVYPLLGFDQFITQDQMPVTAQKLRGFYSDSADFDKVIDLYEKRDKNKPLFLFNVTIQNHGGYTRADENFKEKIKITDEKASEEASRYLSLVHESDQDFKKIVDYFKKQKEPTIVLMYGDHQPKLPDAFYELLYGKQLDKLSLDELQKKFTVPFYIWANYKIPSQSDVKNISCNYLSTLLLEQTNLKMTPYQSYLKDLESKIKAINVNGYVTSDGKSYKTDTENSYSEAINQYKYIMYNNLEDEDDRVTKFFSVKQ